MSLNVCLFGCACAARVLSMSSEEDIVSSRHMDEHGRWENPVGPPPRSILSASDARSKRAKRVPARLEESAVESGDDQDLHPILLRAGNDFA